MRLRNFAENECGAVTTDWVVMTAAIVGIGMAVLLQMSGGLENTSRNIVSGIGEVTSESGLSESIIQPPPSTPSLSDTIQTLQDSGVRNNKIVKDLTREFQNEAPEGYRFSNEIEVGTEIPVFRTTNAGRKTYNVGGDLMNRAELRANVETINLRDYVKNN